MPLPFDQQIVDDTKVCNQCQVAKSLFEFYWQYNKPRGSCIKCCNNRGKEYWQSYYQENKDRFKDNYLVRKYGITIEQYNELLERQDYVCAICKSSETATEKNTLRSLAVDHCHSTGRVRGLLCTSCNFFLGQLESREEMLDDYLRYLENA